MVAKPNKLEEVESSFKPVGCIKLYLRTLHPIAEQELVISNPSLFCDWYH